MPCRRASLQVIRPLPLSSQSRSVSTGLTGADGVGGAGLAGAGVGRSVAKIMSVPGAAGQHTLQRQCLTRVDREGVLALDGDHAAREPAAVHRRQPLGGVQAAFAGNAAAVHRRRRKGEIERVGGEAPAGCSVGGAEAAVMRLGEGDDMFNVRLARVCEISSRVRSVNAPAHRRDDAGLERLRIGVVAAVIRFAAMFRRDDKPAPVVAGGPGPGGGRGQEYGGGKDAGKERRSVRAPTAGGCRSAGPCTNAPPISASAGSGAQRENFTERAGKAPSVGVGGGDAHLAPGARTRLADDDVDIPAERGEKA